jgi:tail tube protein
MASTAIPTMGTTIQLNNVPLGQIMDITGPQLSTDTDEITNHSSHDNTEEFIATVKRTGEITFSLVFDPENSGHSALFTAWDDRSLDAYIMTYPDDTGQADAGASWDFNAYCTGFSMTAPVTGHLAADVTLRVTGAPVFNPTGS